MGKIWITCKQCNEYVHVQVTAKDKFPEFCSKRCVAKYQKKHHVTKARAWTKTQDNTIRFAYSNFKTRTKALDYIKNQSEFDKLNRAIISRRAKVLGLIPKIDKNMKYSKEEKAIIDKYIGFKHPKDIARILRQKGFNRSTYSVQAYCTRNKFSYKLDIYSMSQTREALGFPTKEKMREWIGKGYLICKKEKGKYLIKPIAIAKFIREHTFELIRYKVDLPFIVALLDEFKPHKTKAWGNKYGHSIRKIKNRELSEY